MIAVPVEFVGGPADGHVREVPGDEDGRPQHEQVIRAWLWSGGGIDHSTYRRRVNPGNDGEHWQYVLVTAGPG